MDKATTIEVDGKKRINALVFLEDGKHLLSGSEDGTIRQWRVEDRKEIEDQRLTANSAVRAIAISGDGNWIVSTGKGMAIVWNTKTRQIAYTVSELTDWVNTVDVSPDSTKFATGSGDHNVVIWAVSSGKRLVELPNWDNKEVISVKFSPDGERIAIARTDDVRVHDAYGGAYLKCITRFSLHMPGVNNPNIAWSSDSRHIFALNFNTITQCHCNEDGPFPEWNIPGHSVHYLTSTGIALPSSGKFVASFTFRSLTFWNTSTHARLGPVFEHVHVDQLYSVALSPDDSYIATGSTDGVITLFNLNDIIPSSLDRRGIQAQIEPRNVSPRTVQSPTGRSGGATTEADDRTRGKVTPQLIPDGIYRIKSNIGNLYLTRPHARAGAVVVQSLNPSKSFQKWFVSHVADGAYDIMNTSELWLTVGIGAPLLVGQKGTTWTFESRGDAFVIGNASNAMAIQLEQTQNVSVLIRNNSTYQRWVLESVTD